jgi:hypothetical protein
MNIFIFSSDRTYRTTSSSFYMLAGSICNGVYAINILTTRLLSASYRIDFTLTSIIWCEVQQFLISTLSLISFHCSSLATMDQYLVILSSVSNTRNSFSAAKRQALSVNIKTSRLFMCEFKLTIHSISKIFPIV